jgi:hypothetical protein
MQSMPVTDDIRYQVPYLKAHSFVLESRCFFWKKNLGHVLMLNGASSLCGWAYSLEVEIICLGVNMYFT